MSLIVVIRNTSDLAPLSNYDYKVLVGDGTPASKTIAEGTIEGHRREDGWQRLVRRVLDKESGIGTTTSSQLNVVHGHGGKAQE